MTTYYVCRAEHVNDLELSQTVEAQLACEIVAAARADDEIAEDLVAIESNSEMERMPNSKVLHCFLLN